MDPPELMDELLEEVLLRVPPDDPATLARAALVAKRWCRLVTAAAYRRRYRRRHRGFHPTSSFRPPRADRRGLRVHDARHGRVLLHQKYPYYHGAVSLIVWDPITGRRKELPRLPREATWCSWKATVLCAAAAAAAGDCDHLDCHRGPFAVVFVGTDNDEMFSYVFSSEAGAWSDPVSGEHPRHRLGWGRSALVGNALFMLFQKKKKRILKYDLSTGQMSVMKVPPVRTTKVSKPYVPIELMTMEDGRLGFARVVRSRLFLWSRDDKDAGWELREVIELNDLLPLEVPLAAATPDLVGFAEGVGIIFLTVGFGTFALDVKSNRVTMVYEGSDVKCLVPYINFCTPVMRAPSTDDEPRAVAASDWQ